MPKFEINEIAIYVGPIENGASLSDLNKEVTILTINSPLPKGGKFIKAFADAVRDWPQEVIYGIQWPEPRFSGYVPERKLRKRKPPDDQLQKFRDTLVPCENLFRDGQLQRWLKPAPVDLEARVSRIFPSPEEIATFFKVPPPAPRLQPFDNFFEME